ncbi:MAG: glycoside hydrolase 100 family protein [Patescibacteria group bacterium]
MLSPADQAYRHAITAIRACARPTGFFASGLPGGYEATWARDSIITSLGASLVGNEFQEPFKKSLELLAANQSVHGQIPNAIGTYNEDRQSNITYNSIDSTLWYLIGHRVYQTAYNDAALETAHAQSIRRALTWLSYQDPNEDCLLVQQPTMDWQDAFPHKYGRVISTQALYYAALGMYGETERAEHIKKVVNGDIQQYLSLYDPGRGYYLPWAWKNHDGDREQETWFDTFGNLMAIVTGLATPEIAERILSYIAKEKIAQPYPCKAIWPPIKPGNKEWHSYFEKSDARTPYEYLNGGIWPFLGGFYVAALIKAERFREAEHALECLAEANQQKNREDIPYGFHEWLHGQTGKPIGNSNPYQAWSAGMYVFAHECVQRKTALFFNTTPK